MGKKQEVNMLQIWTDQSTTKDFLAPDRPTGSPASICPDAKAPTAKIGREERAKGYEEI
jgi:hypothetical protein